MKYTKSISIIALLSASSAWAATTTPYYSFEILSVDTDGSNIGPFPSAITEEGSLFAAYAFKAQLEQDIDLGLPFTFNQTCFYDDDVCDSVFKGSESSTELSFENAYQAWRNAMFDIDAGNADPSSYFFGATSNINVEGFGSDTDVKVTDVVDSSLLSRSFAVGYGSAPYASDAARDFVRRGFITDASTSTASVSLMPDFDTDGGFTSAYKMRDVEYSNGDKKTLIVGNSSKSLSGGDDDTDNFDLCYSSGDTNEVETLNDLVYCPGFDTQAWAWEYDGAGTEITGFALATEWLDDNTTNEGSKATYSAAALDINSAGIAVGVSSFEYSDSDLGARQRAIIMTPSDDGVYGEPTVITSATDESYDASGDYDDEDTYYNSWAQTITDDNIVMGNRQYSSSKNVNKPVEMFIYNIDNNSIDFPLLNKKILSTKQRLAGDSSARDGANSRGYDMNNSGLIVGKADAYDQIGPVTGGSPRTQSAFLYDNTSGDSWFLEDLLCSADANGKVSHPLIRLQSATAINDNGVILAQGYQYDTIDDYTNKANAGQIMVKLTPDLTSEPNNSPNCWESSALVNSDASYERSGGGASFALWLFALPLLLTRRFFRKNNKTA
ncbi:DUF3466 family protein [Psychromonas sp. SR45-3]|uniref:DUF3466 family protein n=1 Tax=Psychromonas sp. SR45-3 TaxID=2760930 RepID=UPI0015FBE894|nr:DUF3466 family protein [Psychromonas sp. SR45-3]MBB1272460.1 DUF3466 family protein [Psychromonas sp. SR45-3]